LAADSDAPIVLTSGLEVRLPVETDRTRFVELFCDDEFMVFSDGVLDLDGANRRFDEMLSRAKGLPFAKQPVVERSTRTLVGYSGVDRFEFEGERRLEFGYRLASEARGRGYASETSRAVLNKAAQTFDREILAMIDPANSASQRVALKLDFSFWKHGFVNGCPDNLYRLKVVKSM
jgi:RimJ/RimL family protein N-acetyltransferase